MKKKKLTPLTKDKAVALVYKTFDDAETANIVAYHLVRFWKAWKKLAKE